MNKDMYMYTAQCTRKSKDRKDIMCNVYKQLRLDNRKRDYYYYYY